MRTAFMKTLFEMAERDPRVSLVVGDLGYSVIEQFAKTYPKQFVNAGVAEQDMTGIAAGMALSGKIVFTYSIANFATVRCLEQIRNDVCYHRANVKIVAVGGGLAYGNLGVSHHATEDLAILRSLPEMTVVAPGDPVETELATRALIEREGPAYLRLGKAGEPVVHTERPSFRIGRAIRVRPGRDLTLISTGGMLATTVAASDALRGRGVEAGVLSMHTISPLDEEAVRSAARQSRAVVTIEEHSIVGGLGGAVAEVLAEMSRHAPLVRIGLAPRFNPQVGDQQYLRQRQGLDLDGILKQIEPILEESHGLVS
jgi:transketolase